MHPTAKGANYEFSLYRRKGINLFPALRSNEQIVTEEGCRDVTIPALSGISRQNANQCLKTLEKEGLLRLEYGGVTIRDPEHLRHYGE